MKKTRSPGRELALDTWMTAAYCCVVVRGNVLPAREYYPVLRELVPYAPVWRQAEDATPAGRAAPAPSEERVIHEGSHPHPHPNADS